MVECRGEPRVGGFQRYIALCEKRGNLFRTHATGGRFSDECGKCFSVANPCIVEFQHRRSAHGLFREPWQMDQELWLVDPARHRFQGQHQFQVTTVETVHLVGQLAFSPQSFDSVHERGIVIVDVQPNHDPVFADPIAEFRFQSGGDRTKA